MLSTFMLGDWQVSRADGSLTRPGASVRLEPQIMSLLLYLCERPGKVVTKNEILDNVWNSRYVSDETLKSAFHSLRKALGDDAREPRYIETIPKRGYRMLESPSGLEHDAHDRARALLEFDASPATLAQARLYFERAIANNSRNAAAHAGLARTLVALAIMGDNARETLTAAHNAAETALQIDPDSAEAYAAAGMIALLRDGETAQAEALFRRALELDEQQPAVLSAYARFLTAQSRHAEAVEKAAAAYERNPLSVAAERELIEALFAARRYGEALTQARRLLERQPGATDVRLGLTFVQYMSGDPVQAYTAFISALEHLGVQDVIIARVRDAFETGGMMAVFELWLQMLEREALLGRRVERDAIALHALLGHKERCFEMLQAARDAKEPYVYWLAVSPLLDPLRSDPRFPQLFPNR